MLHTILGVLIEMTAAHEFPVNNMKLTFSSMSWDASSGSSKYEQNQSQTADSTKVYSLQVDLIVIGDRTRLATKTD
jgi:hypothetical protein